HSAVVSRRAAVRGAGGLLRPAARLRGPACPAAAARLRPGGGDGWRSSRRSAAGTGGKREGAGSDACCFNGVSRECRCAAIDKTCQAVGEGGQPGENHCVRRVWPREWPRQADLRKLRCAAERGGEL